MAAWLGLPAVNEYNGLNIKGLPLNQAYVIANTSLENIAVYSVSDACVNCPYKIEKRLQAGKEVSWQVNTSYQSTWRVMKSDANEDFFKNNRRGMLCHMRPTFGEFGVYRLDVGKCELKAEVPPVNIYRPLLLFSLLLLSCFIIYYFMKLVFKRKNNEFCRDESINLSESRTDTEKTPSLHFLRGLLTSLIIFITSGGGGYSIFNKEWGGLSLAECLFFMYVWTVGVKIPSHCSKAFNAGQKKRTVIANVFVRSFLLIFLGILIDSTVYHNPAVEPVPYWCPLQRIGLAYFIVASAYVLTVQKFKMETKRIACKAVADFMSLLWCWIISGFLLATFVILISTFTSFNCQGNAFDQEDQRLDNFNITEETMNCNNDFTETINKIFVAEPKRIVYINHYYGFSRGLLGIMSTVLQTMIGLKAGIVYMNHKSELDRLKLWCLWATLFGIGGVIVGGISGPLKFNLWPVSTIFLISTSAAYLFTLTYTLTTIWKYRSSILTSCGVTSLVILSGHLLFSKSVPFSWDIELNNHFLYLAQNVWTVVLWGIIGFVLKKKRVRFSI